MKALPQDTCFDALGREVNLSGMPERIVSLVPSLTELLYDLGLERQVVGITKYCVHPPHFLLEKTVVGGTKKVKFPLIEELQPDFFLCSKEENTPEMVERLERIAPVYVSDVKDYASALSLIEHLGEILNRRTRAQQIIQKIDYEKRRLDEYLKDLPVLRGMYFIWANPYMAVGGDTFISDMMRLAKIENVLGGQNRYPEVAIRRIRVLYRPDVFLFSSEPYDFKDEDIYEVMRYNHHTVAIDVDGQYFTWYGSRMTKAFAYFRKVREKLL